MEMPKSPIQHSASGGRAVQRSIERYGNYIVKYKALRFVDGQKACSAKVADRRGAVKFPGPKALKE